MRRQTLSVLLRPFIDVAYAYYNDVGVLCTTSTVTGVFVVVYFFYGTRKYKVEEISGNA